MNTEEPGKDCIRSLLTACKEAVCILRSLNDHEKVCRELIAAKLDGGYDLSIILTNVMRRLDNAAEAMEKSLSPRCLEHGDFENWLSETFCFRDADLKIESIPYAHVLNYEQAVQLVTYIWDRIKDMALPWWRSIGERP